MPPLRVAELGVRLAVRQALLTMEAVVQMALAGVVGVAVAAAAAAASGATAFQAARPGRPGGLSRHPSAGCQWSAERRMPSLLCRNCRSLMSSAKSFSRPLSRPFLPAPLLPSRNQPPQPVDSTTNQPGLGNSLGSVSFRPGHTAHKGWGCVW